MSPVRRPFALLLEAGLARQERRLKWLALVLGVASTIAIVQDLDPWPMVFGLPFCLIWIGCAWLHGERQLKWINLLFTALYIYGLLRWGFADLP
ncbi:peptidase [Jannaschia marina]|uniref:peptidase n=1 Tax=Jannaschia marina TaxID=2741674 RepID=UPI0015CD487B|nr:peptidase [Jannaschia marina]